MLEHHYIQSSTTVARVIKAYTCPHCGASRKEEVAFNGTASKVVEWEYDCGAKVKLEKHGINWTKKILRRCVR